MLYILTEKSELNFSNIWRGHLNAIRQALDINNSSYRQVDVLLAKQIKFKSDDIIINIGNHQYLGGELLISLAESVSKVSRTVFFMDDYTAPPPTQMRKALTKSSNLLLVNIKDLNVLTQRKSLDMFEKIYVNLNKASFKLLPLKEPKYPKSFIYWGVYRAGRNELFFHYFKPKIYKTFVSSSERSHKKFADAWLDYRPLDKFKTMPNDLQNYGFTVYIEDKSSPLHSISNRFFEAVSAGLPIFFDCDSISHIELPDHAENYIVSNAGELVEKDLQKTQAEQRKLWGHRNYQRELINDFGKIFYRYGIL